MLKNKAIIFPVAFLSLFLVFYYFNIGFFSITSPQSSNYIPFFADNFNYIRLLRQGLLMATAGVLRLAGYTTITNEYQLLIVGHGGIRLVYSCLGLGLMSFFAAFVIAYPKSIRKKIPFFLIGLLVIQLLNILRMAAVALFWGKKAQQIIDHHIIFNGFIYIVIGIALYFWVTADEKKNHAKN